MNRQAQVMTQEFRPVRTSPVLCNQLPNQEIRDRSLKLYSKSHVICHVTSSLQKVLQPSTDFYQFPQKNCGKGHQVPERLLPLGDIYRSSTSFQSIPLCKHHVARYISKAKQNGQSSDCPLVKPSLVRPPLSCIALLISDLCALSGSMDLCR